MSEKCKRENEKKKRIEKKMKKPNECQNKIDSKGGIFITGEILTYNQQQLLLLHFTPYVLILAI